MKKIILILLSLVLVGFILSWIFIGFGGSGAPAAPSRGAVTLPNAGSTFPASSGSAASGEIVSLGGANGQVIQAKEFLNSPGTGEYSNSGYYYIGYHTAAAGAADSSASTNPPYLIEYIAATQYFNISLLHEPIGDVREEAEQYLMAQLGITQDQMCQLEYMVSVPQSVNAAYAGKNLGFSFCPDAVTLPQ